MSSYSNKIAITTGEPNGIGAEITVKALNKLNVPANDIVVISSCDILNENGGSNLPYEVINLPYNGKINAGIDSPEGGEFSFRQLETACKIKPRGIVTAPVSKNALHLAGHFYNGQTEILEHFLAHSSQRAEMLFTGSDFRVFLLTRHAAIKEIHITKELIISKIQRLQEFFKSKTKIKNPKFGLCALNPHAGESGILGWEEIEIITPAAVELRKEGIDVTNPISADNLLAEGLRNYLNKRRLPYDCYIAMYHDQGLIPVKAAAMDETVNMTIGLDIIRTSPSHGTAYNIAGHHAASEKSMIAAIKEIFRI